MSIDIDCWNPLSLSEVQALFHGAPVQWWIAGGWALDLYLERQTREHSDIDVVILREDHLKLQDYLQHGWELFKAIKGEIIPWKYGESLTSQIDNIWVKKKGSGSWALQVMIMDTENLQWVYKRNDQIRKAVNDIGLKSESGIPYLKPEIQLLYKGGSSRIREKDLTDLFHVLPEMAPASRCWLQAALLLQFSEGHSWVHLINHHR
ncbi:hypothetical protein JMA_03070 [Jeotgalibacillus malaysiensis]|uniref:Aminoglycoside-2''-adenylyltransferase n=1 Tax=Jeotgalibacillus malaysiensis TaxID=1508404 RepID=A0A0B5ANN7_9BACL|nr:hypothetical protein [Jeotgalibacillus malaysiensis]AJD89624.1 hypothetical protein JMA_03070 [Jeotgalibacillus malaysiensis]